LEIVKSGCGILGIMRKQGASKVRVEETLNSIECVRYRGSRLGAGFAVYDLGRKGQPIILKAFVNSEETVEWISTALGEYASNILTLGFDSIPVNSFASWTAYVEMDYETAREAVNRINSHLLADGIKGRIYSWGRYVNVFKGVGYPSDVCSYYGLADKGLEGDLWLAHTRQPTNSPGVYPIWSHPFASHEWAIVHNGDVSSFGANIEFLRYRGYESFVGTDSEVIAYILDYLTNVEELPISEAAHLLTNPPADGLSIYRGACLDGPFSVIAGYCDGQDVYMLALADRSKFRPLVVGEDDERIYAASEEAEIRTISAKARVWPLSPGGIFLASLRKGIILSGRENFKLFYRIYCNHQQPDDALDVSGMTASQVNRLVKKLVENGVREIRLKNVNGHRYLGINIPEGTRLHIYGVAGNCLANFNKSGEIIVYGNAQDDVGDAMYGGRVIIHGDARDVVGQALQGGEIFVRGSVGNRAAIQMREFHGNRPYLVIGGRTDDYLGEYMAGGVVFVLGIDALERDDIQLVGHYTATGMVGGRIYIRGEVERSRISLNPPKADVMQYLDGLAKEGLIDYAAVKSLGEMKAITYDDVRKILSGEPLRRISKLYRSKYYKELRIDYRMLSDDDHGIRDGVLKRFFREFHFEERLYDRLLSSRFTVIEPVGGSLPLEKAEE
jgi:glutamate synthase domain-containing protein 1/glutamate synthase domain-containing protein 3